MRPSPSPVTPVWRRCAGPWLLLALVLLLPACASRAPRPVAAAEASLSELRARQIVSAWQQQLADYIEHAGGGDPAVLARLPAQRATGTLRPARITFGALDIDGSLVASHGGDTIALANGCLCCSIGDSLVTTLLSLLEQPGVFDHIVVEASGVADPGRIADIGVLESMGSDKYAYFDLDHDGASHADAASVGAGQFVARLSPESQAARGSRTELFYDTRKVSVFDQSSGANLRL